jgi:hypothetical protein
MHLLVFFFLIVGCLGDIKVSVDEKGGYTIRINGKEWFRSSHTALYTDNKWYSSDNNSLPLVNITTGQGNDPNLGSWNETQLNYDLVRKRTNTKIVASIREWHQISAITFYLDTGDQILTNTVPLDMNQVRTVFPSFNIENIDHDDQRGYFTFAGRIIYLFYSVFFKYKFNIGIMTGNGGKHAGIWNSSSKVIHSGMESGPIVIFNQT